MTEGLSEVTSDVKETHEKVPSLNYINSPAATTKRLLEQSRKEDMLKQLNQYEAKVGSLPDAKARLEEREGAFLRKTYKGEGDSGKTKAHIDAARKEADVDNLTKKYGTVTIGIHGQELPKFIDEKELKEWWKIHKGYTEVPEYGQSQAWIKQTHKYWAKPDTMRLADFNAEFNAAPVDPFKVDHTPQKYKFDVAPHVHKITHWK